MSSSKRYLLETAVPTRFLESTIAEAIVLSNENVTEVGEQHSLGSNNHENSDELLNQSVSEPLTIMCQTPTIMMFSLTDIQI